MAPRGRKPRGMEWCEITEEWIPTGTKLSASKRGAQKLQTTKAKANAKATRSTKKRAASSAAASSPKKPKKQSKQSKQPKKPEVVELDGDDDDDDDENTSESDSDSDSDSDSAAASSSSSKKPKPKQSKKKQKKLKKQKKKEPASSFDIGGFKKYISDLEAENAALKEEKLEMQAQINIAEDADEGVASGLAAVLSCISPEQRSAVLKKLK